MTEIGKNSLHKTTHQDGGADELDLAGMTPGVHKTTHQDAGADEIDATGLTGTGRFVDRGDPGTQDFSLADLTTDGTYRDLDLSSFVPPGAIAVLLRLVFIDNEVGSLIRFRKNGNVNLLNVSELRTQGANVWFAYDAIVSLDANRVIEYYASDVTWTYIFIQVGGWWI